MFHIKQIINTSKLSMMLNALIFSSNNTNTQFTKLKSNYTVLIHNQSCSEFHLTIRLPSNRISCTILSCFYSTSRFISGLPYNYYVYNQCVSSVWFSLKLRNSSFLFPPFSIFSNS